MPVPFALSAFALFVLLMLALRMRPRRFYFVRHGETILNAQHVRQGADGSLSENGKQQASRTARALKGLSIRRIISSPYQRAKETADIINGELHVPIVYSLLLAERRNPKEIIGKSTSDPEVMRIVDQMYLSYHDDNFRVSDEENFTDLKKRARKCLALLGRQGARTSVVVTHHHFLKMLLAYALYRERLHSSEFVKLAFFNPADNAAVTVCDYHPWKRFSGTRGWEVVSYNQTIPE